MKIINGHDYWDSAAAYGIDETVCLIRNTNKTEYDLKSNDYFFPMVRYNCENDNKRKILPLGCILVSGKAYPFAYHTDSDPTSNNYKMLYNTPISIMYSIDEIVHNHPEISKRTYWGSDIDDLNIFYNQKSFTEKNVTKFLIENKCSIALILPEEYSYVTWGFKNNKDDLHYKSSVIWKNPSFLKDYSFFKIKDSFTMFMEVLNWVSGVLPNSIETVDISNKSKILKAGFDVKYSFRKTKEK
jgi:hypothetical protein